MPLVGGKRPPCLGFCVENGAERARREVGIRRPFTRNKHYLARFPSGFLYLYRKFRVYATIRHAPILLAGPRAPRHTILSGAISRHQTGAFVTNACNALTHNARSDTTYDNLRSATCASAYVRYAPHCSPPEQRPHVQVCQFTRSVRQQRTRATRSLGNRNQCPTLRKPWSLRRVPSAGPILTRSCG